MSPVWVLAVGINSFLPTPAKEKASYGSREDKGAGLGEMRERGNTKSCHTHQALRPKEPTTALQSVTWETLSVLGLFRLFELGRHYTLLAMNNYV